MRELDEERAELARYQDADKERRGIEYAIYDRELTAVKKQLEEVRCVCGGHTWWVPLLTNSARRVMSCSPMRRCRDVWCARATRWWLHVHVDVTMLLLAPRVHTVVLRS